MTHPKVTVRPGAEHDLEELNGIYNQYVKETPFTFDVEPMTIESRQEWFSHYRSAGRHRLLVAVSDEAVVGFTCSSRFRPKPPCGYIDALKPTLLVPIAVLASTALTALLIKRYQRPAVQIGEPASEELAAAAS